MRQKRAKAYKKQMNIYIHTFKFREPFQTLVDDEIVHQCYKAQFDIVKGLNRTIQAETKPMITQCCMQALYLRKDEGTIALAKTFERRRCNHNFKDPKTPMECLLSVVNVDGGNKHRYIVASQSVELRRKLRCVAGVPLVFMNRSVMVMEPASDASKRMAIISENKKLETGLNDKRVGFFEKLDELPESGQPTTKKRKGSSEPNPLSVKKKKKETQYRESKSNVSKKKRIRRHKNSSPDKNDEIQEPEENLDRERSTNNELKENDLMEEQNGE